MPDDLSGFYDEFVWNIEQDSWYCGPVAARLRLAGVETVKLSYHTPNHLHQEFSPIPVAVIRRRRK